MKWIRIWFGYGRMGQLRNALRAAVRVLAEDPVVANSEICLPATCGSSRISSNQTHAIPSWQTMGTWLKKLTEDA